MLMFTASSPRLDDARRVLPAQGRRQRLELLLSFLFLPPERRRAITALYAFCREVDDVVDEAPTPASRATKLAWWRPGDRDNLYANAARASGDARR